MSCNRNPRLVVTKEAEMLAAPRYGLFAAGTVVEDMDPRAHNGIEYESVCDPGVELHPMANCTVDDPGYVPEKIARRSRSLTEASPFALYAAERCLPLGETTTRTRDALRARITRGERHLVELAVDSGLMGASPYLRHPEAQIPTAEPVPLVDAIGILEQQLAEAGRAGIIHAPRWTAPRFSHLGTIQRDGARMRTTLGTTISFGSGYTGLPPVNLDDDGFLWLYATGPVTISRSAIIEPATLQTGAFDPRRNDMLLLAERVYVVDWSCHTWAIPVDLDRAYTATLPLAPPPTISAHPVSGPAPLSVELTVDNHGHGPVTASWGDGADLNTIPDGGSATHTYTDPDEYTISAAGADTPSRDSTVNITVTAPLSAPDQLDADAESPVALNLSWEWARGSGPAATHFELRWAPLGGDWSQPLQIPASAREHTVEGLTPGQTYEFTLRALGEHEVSSEATGAGSTPPHPAPGVAVDPESGFAPLAVETTVDNHGHGPVTITWAPGTTSTILDGGTATHTYTDPGVHPIAVASDLWSAASTTVEVTATGPVAPPTDLTADAATPTTLGLQWGWSQQDGPAVDRFQIRFAEESGELGNWIDLPLGAREHTLTDLTPGTTYQVQVRAGAGTYSSDPAVTTRATQPHPDPVVVATPDTGIAPLSVDVQVDNHGHGPVTADWGDGTGVVPIDDGGTADHTYTDPGEYTVAVASDLWPNAAGATSVTATGSVAPPTDLTADAGEESVSLAWSWGQADGPAVDRFQVRHTPEGTPQGAWSDLPADRRDHTITGLTPGTTYQAQVRAAQGDHTSTPASTSFTTVPAEPDPEEPEPEPDPEAPEPAPEPDEE